MGAFARERRISRADGLKESPGRPSQAEGGRPRLGRPRESAEALVASGARPGRGASRSQSRRTCCFSGKRHQGGRTFGLAPPREDSSPMTGIRPPSWGRLPTKSPPEQGRARRGGSTPRADLVRALRPCGSFEMLIGQPPLPGHDCRRVLFSQRLPHARPPPSMAAAPRRARGALPPRGPRLLPRQDPKGPVRVRPPESRPRRLGPNKRGLAPWRRGWEPPPGGPDPMKNAFLFEHFHVGGARPGGGPNWPQREPRVDPQRPRRTFRVPKPRTGPSGILGEEARPTRRQRAPRAAPSAAASRAGGRAWGRRWLKSTSLHRAPVGGVAREHLEEHAAERVTSRPRGRRPAAAARLLQGRCRKASPMTAPDPVMEESPRAGPSPKSGHP